MRPLFLLGLVLVACGSQPKQAPLTQRQRDSVIGASSLPGARGVKGALAVQDSAAKKRAMLDSIAKADSR
ncbi:MAG TPA: hypothetical protein VE967_16140 [Gemmatimonadaceae bacterium]|nr:hypothetical protein [Gemmatimonadaceae bacterium]